MTNPSNSPQQSVPSVDRVLNMNGVAALAEIHGRAPVTEAVRAVIDESRTAINTDGEAALAGLEESALTARIGARLEEAAAPSLKPVFNLTGTVLHTNLGRAPLPEITPANPGGRGTNHWPWAYVVVGFGAFADEERSGVVGAIGEDARAISSVTPTEHRAAMLLAMGVWPFSSQSFAVGDVRGAGSELEAALKLRTEILGYPV